MTRQPAHSHAHTRSEMTGRIISIGLLCLGILLLFLAFLSTVELVRLRVFGRETSGYVVRQEIKQERVDKYEDGREYTEDIERYYAVISFRTSHGNFTIRSWDAGTNTPLYPTESQVTVVYTPDHPEKARIQQEISGFRGIFGPVMLLVFGGALIGTSWLLKFFR